MNSYKKGGLLDHEALRDVKRLVQSAAGELINPTSLSDRLLAGMPEMVRRKVTCEWLRDEMQNRSSVEFAHYLTGVEYDFVNPGFVLTFRFPFDADFLNSCGGDVEIERGKDGGTHT